HRMDRAAHGGGQLDARAGRVRRGAQLVRRGGQARAVDDVRRAAGARSRRDRRAALRLRSRPNARRNACAPVPVRLGAPARPRRARRRQSVLQSAGSAPRRVAGNPGRDPASRRFRLRPSRPRLGAAVKVDPRLLVRIATRAMEERGFLPWPPPSVLDEASAAATLAHFPADEVHDLRELPWSSIDNAESRDLDQIEVLDGDRLLVGIADVDHFVPQKSQTDGFAGHNTTSVYTGVKVFPMLPQALSENASSLLPEGDRLAVVMETEIRPDG